jgi:hypothetical protein
MRITRTLSEHRLLATVAVLLATPLLSIAGPLCTGAHWVDSCPGGVYNFDSTSTVSVQLDLDNNGSMETVLPFLQLTGTTSVYLDPGNPHVILTELVSLLETAPGVILRAGDGVANRANDGPLYSPGSIVETGNNAFADSFFDVFFEVEINVGPTLILRNNDALEVTCANLPSAPPNLCQYYVLNTPPLDLFDPLGNLRGQLLSTPADFPHHLVTPQIPTVPEPSTWFLLAGGIAAIVARRRSH